MWNPFKSRKESIESESYYEKGGEIMPIESDLVQNQPTSQTEVQKSLLINPMEGNLKVAEMGASLASQAMDVYRTSLQVEQNITAIRAASEVQLANITQKFEFCKSALEHVFQDRHSALAAHYCVLGDAMKSNDREMIITALKGISSIVVSSPLADFKEIINSWDGYTAKKPLELDF